VLVEELAQRTGVRSLQLLQARPAFQQPSHQGAGYVIEPLQKLRKIQLQTSRQAIILAGLLVHHAAPLLHQKLQQTGSDRVWLQGAQAFAVTHQKIQQRRRIARIPLGAGSAEGFPVACGRGGMDRVHHQVRVLGQHVD
jgi:predicted TIM-barrel enzyme